MKFLLTGGVARDFGNLLGHGHGSKYGQLALLDWDSKTLSTLLKYSTPKEFCADIVPSVYFTSASLIEGRLYLCSTTQVFVYEYPSMKLTLEINHPYLNDVHHVTKIGEIIYVASTGIDAVLGFNDEGELVDAKNSMGKSLWHKFSAETDFRKIASTKPHESHPNFVFNIGDDIWTTRFEQKDAVNLNDFEDIIDIEIERPHDGHVIGDYVYFTTVNGCIVKVNKDRKKVDEVFDLNEIDTRGQVLGWCRSLAIVGDYAFVGFSKLRSTSIEKNLRWIKSMIKKGEGFNEALPARVAMYDLKNRKLVDEYVFEENDMSIIFSIIDVT